MKEGLENKIKMNQKQFDAFVFSCTYNRSICRSAKVEYARMNKKDLERLRQYVLDKYVEVIPNGSTGNNR